MVAGVESAPFRRYSGEAVAGPFKSKTGQILRECGRNPVSFMNRAQTDLLMYPPRSASLISITKPNMNFGLTLQFELRIFGDKIERGLS